MVHGDDVGRNDLRCQADILGTNEEWFRPFCFTSTEARMLITRDGDKEGRGRKSEGCDRGYRPRKTGDSVDRRQNNGSVKSVSRSPLPSD